MPVNESQAIQVFAIVPYSAEPGSDEVLVLRGNGTSELPVGYLRPGERLLAAAARIVLEQAGFMPEPVRLVYVLERRDGALSVGVHCNLPEHLGESNALRGEFITLSQNDVPLEPMAVREILVEDLRSGFIRPVAHLVEAPEGESPTVHITW